LDDGTECDAIKSTSLSKLPPILMIQLKRFCFLENKNCKIMKRIEFEETLDLTNYFSCKETKNQLPLYDLYAVIVHKGDSDSGHYYVYIKNTKDEVNNPFIKFDDRVVKYATREEVFFENFVKNSIEIEKNGFFYRTQEESKNTPYILVYTDSSKKDYLFENYSIDKVKFLLIKIPPETIRILSKRERNTAFPKKFNSIYSENKKVSNVKFPYENNKNTMNVQEDNLRKTGNAKEVFNYLTNNTPNKHKKQSGKNGLESNKNTYVLNNIDNNIKKFTQKKDMIRTFKIQIYKNKSKAFKNIEISTSCDKKITVNDFLLNVIRTYNKSQEVDDFALLNAKLLLSSKYHIFDKFLNEHEEIQEKLFEIHQTKNIQLSVIILDHEEILDFENFLKKESNSIQYFNINFPGHSENIPPCFTTLNLQSSNTYDEKILIHNLQKFLKENYNLEIERTKMFFIRIDESVYKSIFTDISSTPIDDYYLRILQKGNKHNFIKIYIKE